jgi:hypothetical protein
MATDDSRNDFRLADAAATSERADLRALVLDPGRATADMACLRHAVWRRRIVP